jgi:hypothetical protein
MHNEPPPLLSLQPTPRVGSDIPGVLFFEYTKNGKVIENESFVCICPKDLGNQVVQQIKNSIETTRNTEQLALLNRLEVFIHV